MVNTDDTRRTTDDIDGQNTTIIISGSYGGHRRHKRGNRRQATPGVWHKLPTGELKREGHFSLRFYLYRYNKYIRTFTRPN